VRLHASTPIVIVATSRSVTTTPFVVEDDTLYARQSALKAYTLDVMPPRPPARRLQVLYLDEQPIAPADEPYVRCRAATGIDARNARPEEVCYRNAAAKKKETTRDKWLEAIAELNLAVLFDGEEKKDHRPYERSWGHQPYYPRIDRADFLARMQRCPAVRRELDRFTRPMEGTAELRRKLDGICPAPSVVLLDPAADAVPSELWRAAAAGDDFTGGVYAEAELLPPFHPERSWVGLLTY
jgi:hypothetical protein